MVISALGVWASAETLIAQNITRTMIELGFMIISMAGSIQVFSDSQTRASYQPWPSPDDSFVVPTIDPMIPKTNPSPIQTNAIIVRLPSPIPLIIFW